MVTRVRRARRIFTEEEKYIKALRVVEEIRSNHCLDMLLSHHTEYKRAKDPSFRVLNNLYKNT